MSSRDLLANRRRNRLARQAKNYEAAQEPAPEGPGEVVTLHDNETPLSDILEKARYEVRGVRSTSPVHVSDLIGKCIRRFALIEKYDIQQVGQQLSMTDSLTFKQGDAIHDVVKDRATRGGPKQVWGNWECRCRQSHTEVPCLAKDRPTEPCPYCLTPIDQYKEVPMVNEEYDIVGTPDLLQYLPMHDCFYINEIKSIAHDKWKEIVRPDPDHVIQVLFYWFLMHNLGYRLSNRVSILYTTKGWLFSGAPYKEFTLNAADQIRRLAPYLEDAKALKDSRAGGELPIRSECPTEEAPKAKKCDACRYCFKDSHDAPKTVSAANLIRRRRPA